MAKTSFYSLLILPLFFSFLLFLPIASPIYFNIPRFDSDAMDIIYEGDAKASVGAIEMNGVIYYFQVGRAMYAKKVPLWNSKTGKASDFQTHFSFSIDTLGSLSYAAGLAFFLAPVGFQIPPNSGGGFLGLFNTTTRDSSGNQIVLVEFDSFSNPEWDPPYEHVGINSNSIESAITTRWNASFHSGDTADAWITYNATTMNLTVSWSYATTSNPRENSSLSFQIDLVKVIPEWVTVGFSAATSYLVERHVINSWEFRSSLDVKEMKGDNEKMIRLVVPVVLSGVLIALVTIGFGIWWRRKQMRTKTAETLNSTLMNDDLERGAGPRRFSYNDLISATNNFSIERMLGEGGFGAVFKGYLFDIDMAVAVKKISRGSKQGKKEYITEVKIISQLRHRNLVQLIGWCHDRGEFLLVYEFMPNGSLDTHLFGKKNPLTWALRYKISLGLASALLYLHEEWEQCVVHRDIKSSNIMLDSSFNVKLGDFGLARLMDHELGHLTTGLAGTLGYMAPEYISSGRPSKESDVFSFGVVALEIATGKKSAYSMEQNCQLGLVEWVWGLYGKQELLLAVDERLQTDFDKQQLVRMMIVGLCCAHPDRNLRLSIRQAIQVLNFEAPTPDLPTKMPVPVYQISAPSVSSGDPLMTNSSVDVGR